MDAMKGISATPVLFTQAFFKMFLMSEKQTNCTSVKLSISSPTI